jgi:hypothetical protein
MNLDLSNIEQRQLHVAMCSIEQALFEMTQPMRELVMPNIPARDYDVIRAYVGTIRNAYDQIDQLLYRSDVREPDPVVEAVVPFGERPHWAVQDDCKPRGIIVTDAVAQARMTWVQHTLASDRLAAQLQRGLITRVEFEAAQAALNSKIEGGAHAIVNGQVPG